ncbi:SAM-dependent methyltransferase [Nereida ignava]|uniref:SAM-dependent methyltransferase n=2 Tax=Nereida TaxID=282198 RepID=UPI00399C0D7E
MTQQPPLTDTHTLHLHHKNRRTPDGMFLQREAFDEISERLLGVKKSFTKTAVVTSWPDLWANIVKGADVIHPDDTLRFTDNGYDLIVHAMDLHWANDPVGQIVQCRNALKPDGLFLAACFGGQTLNELRSAIAKAESRVMGGLSPRVVPMGEVRDYGALLQRAGLALPVADTLTLPVSYSDTTALMIDLRKMGESNALTARTKKPTPKSVFDALETVYRQNFSDGKRLIATFEIIFLAGWVPDASQQQPLKPGSAKMKLADALRIPDDPKD